MGIPCNICGKCFSREDNLQRHVVKVHSAIRKSFKCSMCAKEFSSQYSSVHDVSGSPPNFICEKCGSRFQRSDMLARHVMSHQDPSNKCKVCGQSFNRKSNLKRHMTSHNEDIVYRCRCGDTFNRKDNLIRHKVKCPGRTK